MPSSAIYNYKLASATAAEPTLTNGLLGIDNGNTVLYMQLATAIAAGPCTIAWTGQTASADGLSGYSGVMAAMSSFSSFYAGTTLAQPFQVMSVNGNIPSHNSAAATENNVLLDRLGAGVNTNVVTFDGTTVRAYSGGFRLMENTMSGSFTVKDLYINLLTNSYFAGIQQAIINIWNTALTYAEVQTVTTANNAYHVSKGGTIEPVRVLITPGDSITAGVGSSSSFNSYVGKVFTTCTKKLRIGNFGHSGGNAAGPVGYMSELLALIPSNKLGCKIAFHLAFGANDLNQVVPGSGYPTSFQTNMSSATDSLFAGGADFVTWSNVMSRTDPSDGGVQMDGYRATANTWMRSMVGQLHGPTALVDVAANANLGANGAANNATYFGDKVHPTDTGHALYATIAAPVIAGLAWGY